MVVGILIVLLCIDTFATGQLMMRMRNCEKVYERLGVDVRNIANDKADAE